MLLLVSISRQCGQLHPVGIPCPDIGPIVDVRGFVVVPIAILIRILVVVFIGVLVRIRVLVVIVSGERASSEYHAGGSQEKHCHCHCDHLLHFLLLVIPWPRQVRIRCSCYM